MNQPGPKTASGAQTNRACDSCRGHKVRCLPDPAGASKTCLRCTRTDRQCVFTTSQKRKQRKRTDTRVAELEKEVQAMRSLFASNTNSIPEKMIPKHNTSNGDSRTELGSVQTASISGAHQESSEVQNVSRTPDISNTSLEGSPSTYYPNADVIDRGILSKEEAYRLFHVFNNKFVQHFPCIVFSADCTAEECRTTKPTLFLAILAAAAAEAAPHIYSTLTTEVLTVYAHRTVMNHEKSLELVQTMIICSVWYYPPGEFAQLKFYEFIHMASTMAVDIGLGKNPKSSRSLRANGIKTEREFMDDAELERRRTFLVCYLITTGASMSMKRPNMLRFSNWTRECLESISQNPKIAKLDRSLVSWVKLTKISEDIGNSFRLDDLGSTADLSEFRAQIMMTGFEKELEEWKKAADADGMNDALLLQYYYTQLYLHEIGLHDDHPPEDFIPPLSFSGTICINTLSEASSSFLEASAVSISSAQAALDIILNMKLQSLRVMPIVNFVRTCYTIIILIKLYISSKSPTSKIGSVLDSRSMRLDYYLQAVAEKLIDAVGPEQHRSPFVFLGIIMKYCLWYDRQKHDLFFSPPADIGRDRDFCWLPPVPKTQWDRQLGVLTASPGFNTEWKWDVEHGPMQSDFKFMRLVHATDVPVSDEPHSDSAAAAIEDMQYDYIENDYGFDQAMLMDDMQYNGAIDGWVPSLDLPVVSDLSYPPVSFDWELQK